jgi:3-phosphoshikimate 1-carboxyvinyltransferase
MKITIQPSGIAGSLTAPASKSVMQRVCAAALLRNGTTIIHNYGQSDDDKAALQLISDMGARVSYQDDYTLTVHAEGKVMMKEGAALNCHESGLSVRMFTPIAALADEEIHLTGSGSLVNRPLDFFDAVLPLMGITIQSREGKLPLKIKGPLQPVSLTVDGTQSSQFLTGLLYAYSASNANGVSIKVTQLNSKPYIDLTLKILEDFGMKVPVNIDYQEFRFEEGKPGITAPAAYTIEADWSGAAFLLVAGAIAGSIVVKGLDVFTLQADKAIIHALQDCGCHLSIQVDQIAVRSAKLKAFHFDATDAPDLFPPLVALAAYCNGTSVIEGVGRLVHKESNRALTLQEEFAKMGVDITLQDDKMIIRGGTRVKGANVSSRNDHRIAMACAVAALGAEGEMTIEGAEAINKSYPGFYRHLEQVMLKKNNL